MSFPNDYFLHALNSSDKKIICAFSAFDPNSRERSFSGYTIKAFVVTMGQFTEQWSVFLDDLNHAYYVED